MVEGTQITPTPANGMHLFFFCMHALLLLFFNANPFKERGAVAPFGRGWQWENDEGQPFLNTLPLSLHNSTLQGYQWGAVTSAMTSLSWQSHVSTFSRGFSTHRVPGGGVFLHFHLTPSWPRRLVSPYLLRGEVPRREMGGGLVSECGQETSSPPAADQRRLGRQSTERGKL